MGDVTTARVLLAQTHPELVERYDRALARHRAVNHPKQLRRQRYDHAAGLAALRELAAARDALLRAAADTIREPLSMAT